MLKQQKMLTCYMCCLVILNINISLIYIFIILIYYIYTYIVGTPFLLNRGVGPSKNWVSWGGGVRNFLLEREESLKNGGVATFLLNYSSITFSLCVGKVKFSWLLFFLRSFELAMQDSHPRFYSTKTMYHLYISDPFW